MKKTIWLSRIIVIVGYIVVSFFMYGHFWQQLWNDESKGGARFGEVLAASWGMEQIYQNLQDGNNPFAARQGQLFPFGASLVSLDAGSGLLFPLFRPWLSVHQTLSIVTVLSIVLANLGMYVLLREFKVQRGIAFLLGLAYGYTTLLQNRMGHLTYLTIYGFPWFYYLARKAIATYGKKAWGYVGLLSVTTAMMLYQNLTYFVILGWSIAMLGIFALMKRQARLIAEIRRVWGRALGWIGLTSLLMSPWLVELWKTQVFDGLPRGIGWGGAIDFSSDLLGIFVPGIYSLTWGKVVEYVGLRVPFVWGIFEQFIYPGSIILTGIASYLLARKKINQALRRVLAPWLFLTLSFWVLTLGPFLHVGGKWFVSLEGIKVVIPLPFVLLHYLPLMDNIRSPGRLAVGMVFGAYLVVGLWLSHLARSKKVLYAIILGLIVGFFVDHPFRYKPADSVMVPREIYQTIANDQARFSTYEMPSVIRDGFTYFGDLSSLMFIEGQLAHEKPMLAGYFGRVPSYKREYFQNNPFLGYFGRLMDEGKENNGALDRTELKNWQEIDQVAAEATADLLEIKYVVLKSDQFYSATAAATLAGLHYQKIQTENVYSLWERTPGNKEMTEVRIGVKGDEMFLGLGWRGRDKGFRWGGKTVSTIFKIIDSGNYRLTIRAAAYYKPQKAKIYVNKTLAGEVELTTELSTQTISLLIPLHAGVNTVHIILPNAYQPIQVEPGNMDESYLAAKYEWLKLERLP